MGRDPYRYFRVEARDLHDQLSRATLDLEKRTTPGLVAQLLRLAHTLKGAARVVKQSEIGDRAHAIEDALAPLRNSAQPATRAQIDAILRYLDEMNACIAALSPQASPPSASEFPAGERVSADDVPRTLRVDIDEMDTLMDGFVEVHAQLGAMQDGLRQSEGIRSLTELLGAQLAPRFGRDTGSRGEREDMGQARAIVEQIATSFDRLNRNYASGMELLERELKQVRAATERMRLIPAQSLFVALERAARDAAQVENKQIEFEGRGGDVRLDAQVLGTVQGALSHVVRNAVVHGIEAPGARRSAGKPPLGRVSLVVRQRGRWIEFTCTDDGRGIDLEAVRRVAAQRGLLPAGIPAPEAEALLQLLLKGGISTLEKITGVAGRGVGLDVVRDAAVQLDGKVELRTEENRGTTLTLTVPLSVASVDGLLVESSGVAATIPMDAVRVTLRIATDAIVRSAQGESLIYGARTIPFLPLASALSLKTPPARGKRAWSAVVVEANGEAAAIGVDRLRGAANVVLRPLPALAPSTAMVVGVSLDIDGNPQLVLDPARLVLAAQRAGAPQPEHEESLPAILVIDDSLTTRMLERSILESAGYAVDLAVSGEEAMEMAHRKRYALFLVDVEMPGMDGFRFVELACADAALHDIPSILVTSRFAPEDLQRGRDVGARCHIVKDEFDQGVLLARIAELVQ